jgi:hypothetical protein
MCKSEKEDMQQRSRRTNINFFENGLYWTVARGVHMWVASLAIPMPIQAKQDSRFIQNSPFSFRRLKGFK